MQGVKKILGRQRMAASKVVTKEVPSTQRTDSSLKATKMDDNAESHAMGT